MYSPRLLFQDSFIEIVVAYVSGIIGVMTLSMIITGYIISKINLSPRIILFFCAFNLLEPTYIGNILGIIILISIIYWQCFGRKKIINNMILKDSKII